MTISRTAFNHQRLPVCSVLALSLLGCAIPDFRDDADHPLPGTNRLYTILISESLYLIWKLRCEWRFQRGANPTKCHSTFEIHNRWLSTINSRLQLDCLLTNSRRYERKALPSALVQKTWHGTLLNEQDLPDNWHQVPGVLVGIGTPRPPGRNR